MVRQLKRSVYFRNNFKRIKYNDSVSAVFAPRDPIQMVYRSSHDSLY